MEGAVEQIVVKKNMAFENMRFIFACILGVALLIFGPAVSRWMIIPAFVFIGLAIYFKRFTKTEFDYSYFQGELTVAAVYSKSHRKEMGTYNFKEAEIIAPEGSDKLKDVTGNRNFKTVDVSSGKDSNNLYNVIFLSNGGNTKLVFEPNEKMKDAIFRSNPSKFVK